LIIEIIFTIILKEVNMNRNFGTVVTILLVINIFIGCFVAFYIVGKSNVFLENQRVMEALILDLDEDIHELQERQILIEAFVKDIDEDIHSLQK
tara:strand:- start:1540 stop:1821 length:282 start_codon:yes stop_codon:yes gene_type:complete